MKINSLILVGGILGLGAWAYTAFWKKFYFEVLGYNLAWNISDPLKLQLEVDVKFTNQTNIQLLIDNLDARVSYGNTLLATVSGSNIILPPGIVDVKTFTAKIDILKLGGDVVARIKSGSFFDKLLFNGTITRDGNTIEFSKPINFLEKWL